MTESNRSPVGDGEREGPVVKDRRRIDPETGELRGPRDAASPAGPAPQGDQPAPPDPQTAPSTAPTGNPAEQAADPAAAGPAGEREQKLSARLSEAIADLQRVQAEYVNYRRRVERDREAQRTQAKGNVLSQFLGVFDDIDRAREHGELEGGFKVVGERLEKIAGQLGLTKFGQVGDPFDPRIHEALLQQTDNSVSGPTCVMIMEPGYSLGDKVLRVARVGVGEPDPNAAQPAPGPVGDGTADGAVE